MLPYSIEKIALRAKRGKHKKGIQIKIYKQSLPKRNYKIRVGLVKVGGCTYVINSWRWFMDVQNARKAFGKRKCILVQVNFDKKNGLPNIIECLWAIPTNQERIVGRALSATAVGWCLSASLLTTTNIYKIEI